MKIQFFVSCAMVAMSLMSFTACRSQAPETVSLRILHTSDVHGHVLDSLPLIAAYADYCRSEKGENQVILTDGGDVLQGHPAAYYYNFVDTTSQHVVAKAMNLMRYDVGAIGNHDIETGHPVYDRWVSQCQFPVLGANVIDESTGEPYLKPYIMMERQGVRIAFLGMLTPAIPNWLPRSLWSGLRFDDILVSARKWVPLIQEREHPDLIIGLFHSGFDENLGIHTGDYIENQTRLVAQQVSGFDLILYGHDHRRNVQRVPSPDGDSILCIGPTSTGACVCQVDIEIMKDRQGRVVDRRIEGKILDKKDMDAVVKPSAVAGFSENFEEEMGDIADYMLEPVGTFTETIRERDAFFGPSAFISLIHDLQFEISDSAEISFAAPLSFDATIKKGTVHISDMFALYKYENLLYTMRLTGREVRDFLEMSYDLWCNTMHSPDDHILLLDSVLDNGTRLGLKNMAFNFESAAGICYTVDVSKPDGQKVSILSMEDGTPFSLEREYLVAINSYRGNGGGELLTRGAGIPLAELPSRVMASTDYDLRYHLIQRILEKQVIVPRVRNNWRFIPDAWAPAALERDREIIFPEGVVGWQH